MIDRIIIIVQGFRENKIVSALFALVSIGALVKLLGFVEKQILANYVGTDYRADAYTVVFSFVFSLFIIFRELIEPGFLNVFTKSKVNNDNSGANALFNLCLRVFLVITLIITATGIFFPDNIIRIIAPGFKDETRELADLLVQLMIPSVIFMVLSNVTKITLNGLKLFTLPALGDLVFKLGIIGGLVLFFDTYGIIAAVIGVVAGAICKLLLHFTRLFPLLHIKKAKLTKEQLNNIWKLSWPLLIGTLFSQLSVIIDNVFASELQEGAISSLSYAKKVMEAPLMFFPEQLGIIIFPYFAQFALENNKKNLMELMGASLHWVSMVFLPISIYFMLYATNIIDIIFARGAFDQNSTLLTSAPFTLYSAGLVFFSFDTIITVFYFGSGDTKTPTFVGISCVLINIILTYILIQYIGYLAIPLAFVAQKVMKVTWLLILMKRKIVLNFKYIVIRTSKIIGIGLIFTFALLLTKNLTEPMLGESLLKKLLYLMLGGLIPGSIYIIFAHRLKLLSVKLKV